MLAVVNARAIVARGAESALPIEVRCSIETPKVDKRRTTVKT